MSAKKKTEKTITIKVDAKTFEKLTAAAKKPEVKKKPAKKKSSSEKTGLSKFDPPSWARG